MSHCVTTIREEHAVTPCNASRSLHADEIYNYGAEDGSWFQVQLGETPKVTYLGQFSWTVTNDTQLNFKNSLKRH